MDIDHKINILIVTDAVERQVSEYAFLASSSASPLHFSVIFPFMDSARVPQRDLISDGLVWTLLDIRTIARS
jgi:hypothetical protein